MKKLLFFSQVLLLTLYSCQKKIPPVHIPQSSDLKKGESFLYRQNDSAFYYFNRVVTTSKDSLQIAMAYSDMGVIQSGAGDYFGSQESLLLSLKFLDERKKDHRSCFAADYNELGLTSGHLKNYESAISYYDEALKFSDYENSKLVILNNKALAYQKKGAYNEALKIYRTILSATKKGGVEYARILSNIAKTKWLQNRSYQAAPELLTALRIRIKKEDMWGQNASYSHLADYYTSKRPDSALFYAEKMYAVALRLNSPDDRIQALRKLIKLGPPDIVKRYFENYQRLSDSLQSARNAAKNQFALIRYQAEKNKADNLKLQKENTEKKYQIIRQEIMLAGLIFLVIVGAIAAVFWYRKRKQRLQEEAQSAIHENQLKTSQKVHDVVANGLYRIMTEVEYQEDLNKDLLLDRIEVLYERSRDISYEPSKSSHQDFHEKITGLITSFASRDTKVLIVGNSEQLWKDISAHVMHELEHVLQELMVNMTKHSQAATVVIRFEQRGRNISVYYTDDGVGIPVGLKHGNGLTNTGNRIKDLNGSISFEANAGKGLKIHISFPIA